MRIHFGNIETGTHENTDRWLGNLQRYPSVRFFGFLHGRVFIGLVMGSKCKSKLQLVQDALIQAEDELAVARRDLAAMTRLQTREELESK